MKIVLSRVSCAKRIVIDRDYTGELPVCTFTIHVEYACRGVRCRLVPCAPITSVSIASEPIPAVRLSCRSYDGSLLSVEPGENTVVIRPKRGCGSENIDVECIALLEPLGIIGGGEHQEIRLLVTRGRETLYTHTLNVEVVRDAIRLVLEDVQRSYPGCKASARIVAYPARSIDAPIRMTVYADGRRVSELECSAVEPCGTSIEFTQGVPTRISVDVEGGAGPEGVLAISKHFETKVEPLAPSRVRVEKIGLEGECLLGARVSLKLLVRNLAPEETTARIEARAYGSRGSVTLRLEPGEEREAEIPLVVASDEPPILIIDDGFNIVEVKPELPRPAKPGIDVVFDAPPLMTAGRAEKLSIHVSNNSPLELEAEVMVEGEPIETLVARHTVPPRSRRSIELEAKPVRTGKYTLSMTARFYSNGVLVHEAKAEREVEIEHPVRLSSIEVKPSNVLLPRQPAHIVVGLESRYGGKARLAVEGICFERRSVEVEAPPGAYTALIETVVSGKPGPCRDRVLVDDGFGVQEADVEARVEEPRVKLQAPESVSLYAGIPSRLEIILSNPFKASLEYRVVLESEALREPLEATGVAGPESSRSVALEIEASREGSHDALLKVAASCCGYSGAPVEKHITLDVKPPVELETKRLVVYKPHPEPRGKAQLQARLALLVHPERLSMTLEADGWSDAIEAAKGRLIVYIPVEASSVACRVGSWSKVWRIETKEVEENYAPVPLEYASRAAVVLRGSSEAYVPIPLLEEIDWHGARLALVARRVVEGLCGRLDDIEALAAYSIVHRLLPERLRCKGVHEAVAALADTVAGLTLTPIRVLRKLLADMLGAGASVEPVHHTGIVHPSTVVKTTGFYATLSSLTSRIPAGRLARRPLVDKILYLLAWLVGAPGASLGEALTALGLASMASILSKPYTSITRLEAETAEKLVEQNPLAAALLYAHIVTNGCIREARLCVR